MRQLRFADPLRDGLILSALIDPEKVLSFLEVADVGRPSLPERLDEHEDERQ